MAKNSMHSSETNMHVTPREVCLAAAYALDGISLDPASCEIANTVVMAATFFDEGVDGLSVDWHAKTVFLNPPGGLIGRDSGAAVWWDKLAATWEDRSVDAAIFVAFKLDQLQISQERGEDDAPVKPMLDFPICYPARRLAYLQPRLPGPTEKNPDRGPTAKQRADFEATGLCTWDAPPHASAIVYLPSRTDPHGIGRFLTAFAPIGACRYDHRYLPKEVRAACHAPVVHLRGVDGSATLCGAKGRDPLAVIELDLVSCHRCKSATIAHPQLHNQVVGGLAYKQLLLPAGAS